MKQIIGFAGSTREKSYNKQLVRHIGRLFNHEVTYETVELNDYPLPLYDADLEADEGIPKNALQLKRLFEDADGIVIASPEYNSSYSAVLKNTIDWVSRPEKGLTPLVQFIDKPFLLISTSPGRLGGLRGLYQLRSLLGNLGAIISSKMVAIPSAMDVFREGEVMLDENLHSELERSVKTFSKMVVKLTCE